MDLDLSFVAFALSIPVAAALFVWTYRRREKVHARQNVSPR
jgi:hypothetical protein